MNELHKVSSPYLLQHKANPIFWKSWNDISLAQAQKENKLIVISVGYAACHWCHVMEHESFQDKEVASLMNKHFVSIKVDREERPDIDAVYMKAVQLMNKQGGWPLNVVALPDGRPVWGGTYFRKDQWINALDQLAVMWKETPEKMLDYADNLKKALNNLTELVEQPLDKDAHLLPALIEKWSRSFDLEFGGMARAPKFMMPTNYRFLMRYAHQQKDEKLLAFVDLTLTKMAYGGIFDVIDGGFSRYSVDMKWHVPHFEKMLYDNGQLLSLYSNAYKRTKNPLYKEVVEKTIAFIEREWLTEEGGFYASFDADSLNKNNIKEEGAFYVWTKEELKAIFKADFELFSVIFSINTFGHWEDDNYVLIQEKPLEKIAQENKIALEDLIIKKKHFEQRLFEHREKRHKPALDDKIITSWNAMTSRGFIEAYKAFGNQKYLALAIKNIEFIKQNIWSENGNLYRTYKNKTPRINAFIEDYAFVIDALIGLYEVTSEEKYLTDAKQLTDYSIDKFYDTQRGLFRYTSVDDASLVSENYEIEDNVIESPNAVMASNLYTLSIYFEQLYYQDICTRMLQLVVPNIDYPSAFSNWLDTYMNFNFGHKEIAICGDAALIHLKEINSHYYPELTVSATIKSSRLPFLRDKSATNILQFFICENQVCGLPLLHIKDVLNQLNT